MLPLYLSKTVFSFLLQDNSFEFEKRRNEPVKYQRELWNKTSKSEGHTRNFQEILMWDIAIIAFLLFIG